VPARSPGKDEFMDLLIRLREWGPPKGGPTNDSAADLIQRPSVRVVLLNERRGRREELNLPTARIDRGDLDLRPTRFNGQVSAWFLLPIPKSYRISAIETPRFVGFCITQKAPRPMGRLSRYKHQA
jgi:hypothetical protein